MKSAEGGAHLVFQGLVVFAVDTGAKIERKARRIQKTSLEVRGMDFSDEL